MSPEFIIRPAEPSDAFAIATVQTETWRTTYAGLMSAEYLANMNANRLAEFWHTALTESSRRHCYFVAVNDDAQVIGFASGGPERSGHPIYKGELYVIYLLDAYQGQGLGRRLVQTTVAWLVENHYHSMLIWVLATNTSGIGFYEAIGGQPVSTKQTEIGGEMLEETGYGWLDLTPLLPAP